MSKTNEQKKDSVTVPLKMPLDLEKEIKRASEKLNMSKQDTMRQALMQGLPKLVDLLSRKPQPSAA